jgi:hypothetical protein
LILERAEESPPSKRRRLVTEFPAEEASQMEDAPKYQRLAPVIRKISLQTIETKWEPLPPACVERISQLVHEVQKPVLVYLNQEKKRMEANSVLQMFSRRLISKITKGIPFPPAMRKSREEDFEFEKILDHNSTLEAQLNPALHANELLEFELAKETAYLEWEQASLMELQANAKSEMAMRKDAERKLHLLLQSHPTIIDDAEKNLFGIGKTPQRGFPLFHTVSLQFSTLETQRLIRFSGGQGSPYDCTGAQWPFGYHSR